MEEPQEAPADVTSGARLQEDAGAGSLAVEEAGAGAPAAAGGGGAAPSTAACLAAAEAEAAESPGRPAPAPPAPLPVPPLGLPSASPRRPEGLRHRGARPQSNRFLKETLAKLSDDSARVGCKLVEDGYGAPSYGRLPGLPLPAGFREETPLALPEQADYLIRRLPWQAAAGTPLAEEGEVRGTAAKAMEGLMVNALPGCDVADIRNAMLAVAHVISSWASDISGTAGKWAKHMDEQYSRYSANNDRWDGLKEQVSTLQLQLERFEARLSESMEASAAYRESWQQFSGRVEGSLHRIGDSVGQVAEQSSQETASVKKAVAERSAEVTEQVRRMIFGQENDRSVPAVEPQLQAIQDGLQELVAFSQKDIAQWQSTTEQLQSAQDKAASEVEAARQKTSEVEEGADKLRQEVAELTEQLGETDKQLQDAKHAPVGAAFDTLKGIEKRGHVKINRQSGMVEATRGLDFAAVKVGQATANWKDLDAAGEALNDLLEISRLFDGPMQTEVRLRPGKGGKPDFWDKVAQVQAEFVKEELKRVGVPELSLMTKGQQAGKNQEPGLFMTLKRDVFDDAAVAALSNEAQPKPAGKK